MQTQFDYSGASVVVTGASRGIGFAVAEGYAMAGADVLIVSSGSDISSVAEDLTRRAKRLVRGAVADISDGKQLAHVFDGIGRIDVLVNNAGLELMTPVDDLSDQVESDFRRIVDINITGTFLTTRLAVPYMTGKGASIINTSSIWGRTSEAGFSAYAASKHATMGLTRTLAKELAPRGIRVNAVCPGWVRTVASMRSLARMSDLTGRTEEDLLAEITANQILPGLMEPADMASAYLFLSSSAAGNITGQGLMVDRGEVMA
ncbi:SDR family oxidoreductase [Ensifer sp. ENS05]|uniref:SDR family NAD(P)-dependent oxidoreductase n=1 Tax=Ensifer sp. ENS05 TaxID=2769277 RepID=UPI00177DA3D0|nr:SDR family NAD(P)-dependent oxidoreductase [Ensifer sp. ENS05]MBD9596907.1 SDR family oxidoreductase [Ensifer sp. ENS05]